MGAVIRILLEYQYPSVVERFITYEFCFVLLATKCIGANITACDLTKNSQKQDIRPSTAVKPQTSAFPRAQNTIHPIPDHDTLTERT